MKHIITTYSLVLGLAALVACNGTEKSKSADSAETKPAVTQAPAAGTGKLLGVWHDAAIHSDKGEQIAYELVSKDDKYYIQAITFTTTDLKVDDSPPISPSASELKKDGDKYTPVDDPTQSYQVHQDGDLVIYDGTNIVAKCKKLL